MGQVRQSTWSYTSYTFSNGSRVRPMQYWNYETGQLLGTSPELPERVYSMDTDGEHLVIATAERHIIFYNLQNPTQPASLPDTPEEANGSTKPNPNPFYSPLSFQTTALGCLPGGTNNGKKGFAVGSIEGRVGVQYVPQNLLRSSLILTLEHSYINRTSLRENYAFRCHRKDRSPKTFNSSSKPPQDLYAINHITFNKAFGTVATLGTFLSRTPPISN